MPAIPIPLWTVSSRVLHLIVMPTERCNLRCAYCYEDFENGRMDPATVSGLKALLAARFPDLSRLDVTWFGGEPLAAVDDIYSLMRFVQCLKAQHSTVAIQSDMTTNGVLLNRETAETLAELGVLKFQISLDGLGDTHDLTRRRINGTGSFSTIWHNLVSIQEAKLPLEILLRLHLTATNQASLEDLLLLIASDLGGDPRFSVSFKPIADLGGPTAGTAPYPSSSGLPERISQLKALASNLGVSLSEPTQEICYASRANSWIVRSDATLAKCTVALSDPRNAVGRLLPDGTMEIQADRVGPWVRGLATGSSDELRCPLIGLPPAAEEVEVEPASA